MTRLAALAALALAGGVALAPASSASASCQEPICNSVCTHVDRAWFIVRSTLDPSPSQPVC